jgi:hypothetical protein
MSPKHVGDSDRPRRVIDDDVGEHRPEFHRLVSEVFTNMTRARSNSKHAHRLGDLARNMAGDEEAGFPEKVALDIVEILLGFWG